MKQRALVGAITFLVVGASFFIIGGDFRRGGLIALAVQAPLILGLGLVRDRRYIKAGDAPGGEPEPGLWSKHERFEDRV